MSLFAGTHNEDSSYLLMELAKKTPNTKTMMNVCGSDNYTE